MYKEQELVAIAKRENNNKRSYLVVNRLQGKHIPVSPKEAFAMFSQLAGLVKKEYENEKLLLIGFAETATAIGAALAAELKTYYMQTTREDIKDVEYLFFSEQHSHATQQKVIKTDLDKVINDIDRIVFVEDEVTTGNTILNIINIIERTYSKKIKFSVASLLNGMNEEAQKTYANRSIKTHYLVKTNHASYTEIAKQYKTNGRYYESNTAETDTAALHLEVIKKYPLRRLIKGEHYLAACEDLWQQIRDNIAIAKKGRVLVLGTEEFMYPALYVAGKIEETGVCARCHATTRSPIAVSLQKEYPLHERYSLASFYDAKRNTFIYDLEKYHQVIIITDAPKGFEQGENALVNAIASCGNDNIHLVRWC